MCRDASSRGTRSTARVPTPHPPNPRPYNDYERDGEHILHCKGVGGWAEWWGPLRSPWAISHLADKFLSRYAAEVGTPVVALGYTISIEMRR
jgi:hypothetical protein